MRRLRGPAGDLYREALGPTAAALAVAALSVMLTTVIAATDAYARTLPAAIQALRGAEQQSGTRTQYVLKGRHAGRTVDLSAVHRDGRVHELPRLRDQRHCGRAAARAAELPRRDALRTAHRREAKHRNQGVEPDGHSFDGRWL